MRHWDARQHAKDGLLNIMASGDIDTFNKVKSVLQDQGENVFYLGALGAGTDQQFYGNDHSMCHVSQAVEAAGSINSNCLTLCLPVLPVRPLCSSVKTMLWTR